MGHTPSFDVIVGAPFLLQADLEIALAARRIKCFRPQHCRDTYLAYRSDPSMTVVPYEGRVKRGEDPISVSP